MSGVACCSGSLDEGIPKGLEKVIGDVNCYLTSPSSTPTKTVVVFITDIFGWNMPNVRLLADKIAGEGSLCYVPDIFNGGAPPTDLMDDMHNVMDKKVNASFFQKMGSIGRMLYYLFPFFMSQSHAKSEEVVRKVIQEIQKDASVEHIFLTGYCYGGYIAIKLAQDMSIAKLRGINAAHAGGLKIPLDYELIRIPSCIVIAGEDFEVKEPQQKIIQETMAKNPVVSQVHVVPDVADGFAMRGSKKVPIINEKRLLADKFLIDFIRTTCPY